MTLVCGVVRMRGVGWFVVVAFFGSGGFEIGVGRSNFKIGLGVAAEIEVAVRANFEV